MRLISLDAISSNYPQIILRLQEVDELDRTDFGVKAGGFRQLLRKFKSFFYTEILRVVFRVVKSVKVQLHSAQLNYRKAQNIISCAKTAITNARTDSRFNTCGMRF